MKYIFVLILLFFALCQTISSKSEDNLEKQISESSTTKNENQMIDSIREIDFQNFTYPWTKTFGGKEKNFTLKNGIVELKDKRNLSLKSLAYIDVTDDYDEQALVNVKIDDGNATYEMLYIFAVENNKPKLLESFEFGVNNIYFRTAFAAHGELVIETHNQLSGDVECCPSAIEITYYRWVKDKFVSQGESLKIPNGYVQRSKKN